MRQYYEEMAQLILAQKEHKDASIRKLVVDAIPVLASFAPDVFAALYLVVCVQHVLKVMNNVKDRSEKSQCKGHISLLHSLLRRRLHYFRPDGSCRAMAHVSSPAVHHATTHRGARPTR